MKAITVQQPWAWAIIHGSKNVENRTRIGTWLPAVGQTIAVHAGKRWSERGQQSNLMRDAAAQHGARGWSGHEFALRHCYAAKGRPPHPFVWGAIIGLVDVADVHPEQGACCAPWGEQSYIEVRDSSEQRRVDVVHLVLERPRPLLVPEPCRGALGLWTVPDDIATAVTDADLGVHFRQVGAS